MISHNGVDCKALFICYNGVVAKRQLEASSLDLLVDFLNTRDERRFGAHRQNDEADGDSLTSPAALKRWLVKRGLSDKAAAVTEHGFARVKDFRRAFRALLANDSDCAARSALDTLVATIPLQARITHGSPALVPASAGLDCALGKLIIAAIVAQVNGTWNRLKMCAAQDCHWVFYDASKNCLGRWCSMEVCGNRLKTRNYRQRIRAKTKRPEK